MDDNDPSGNLTLSLTEPVEYDEKRWEDRVIWSLAPKAII